MKNIIALHESVKNQAGSFYVRTVNNLLGYLFAPAEDEKNLSSKIIESYSNLDLIKLSNACSDVASAINKDLQERLQDAGPSVGESWGDADKKTKKAKLKGCVNGQIIRSFINHPDNMEFFRNHLVWISDLLEEIDNIVYVECPMKPTILRINNEVIYYSVHKVTMVYQTERTDEYTMDSIQEKLDELDIQPKLWTIPEPKEGMPTVLFTIEFPVNI